MATLTRVLDDYQGFPAEWGSSDCACFIRDCLLVQGAEVELPAFLCDCQSEGDAVRTLEKMGGGSIERGIAQLLDEAVVCLRSKASALERTGDLVPGAVWLDGLGVVGVVGEDYRFYQRTEIGVQAYSPAGPVKLWRVKPSESP